jgi:hypothetical protein
MYTYRLSPNPDKLGYPRWRFSRTTKEVWVRAVTSGQAWSKVANATMAVYGTPLGRSPWYDDAFTSCVVDVTRDDVPDDAVVTSDGHHL